MQESPSPELSPIPDAVVEATAIVGDVKTSPFHPRNLFDLFFRPRRFFTNLPLMQQQPNILFLVWLYGICISIRFFVWPQFTRPTDSDINSFVTSFPDSLPNVFLIFLGGTFIGVLVWGFASWFIEIRSRWAGEPAPDASIARKIYIYSTLIVVLPQLSIVSTHIIAYIIAGATSFLSQESILRSWVTTHSVIIFLNYWSVFTVYNGVRTYYQTRDFDAVLLFIVFPLLPLIPSSILYWF